MKTVFINGKKYTVERVFNMVCNYEFTDKNGYVHLVDGEDVGQWVDDENIKWTNGVDMAIKYAKWLVNDMGNTTFWWGINEPKVFKPAYSV